MHDRISIFASTTYNAPLSIIHTLPRGPTNMSWFDLLTNSIIIMVFSRKASPT